MKNQTITLTAVCIITLFLITNASAIGVSPGTVSFSRMVRGGYAEKTLAISTAGDEDLLLKIEATGDVKDWITFEPSGSQILLPKKSSKPILVKIAVPSTARNGLYEGNIIISTMYQGAEGGDVSGARFMPGIIVKVQLTVTGEEVAGYEIKSVSVKDTEQGYPAEFLVNVENTGNVIITPKLHIIILNSERRETGKILDYSETAILPTTSKMFSIKMPTKGMEVAAYYAKITSDLGDEQTIFFQVLAPGTLAIKGSLGQVSLNKIWVKPGEIVKVEGAFKNEGEVIIEQSAKVRCEAHLIDPQYNTKALVKQFEGTDAMTVPIGGEVSLDTSFTPEKSGRYSIECFAIYSGKRTDVKSTILNVLEEPVDYTIYYILIGAIVVAIVFYLTRLSDDGRTRRFRRMWGDYLNIK
jgi:hypothetical protein